MYGVKERLVGVAYSYFNLYRWGSRPKFRALAASAYDDRCLSTEPPQGADGSWSSPIFIALQNATLGRLATLSEPVRVSPDWSYSRELRRDSKGRPVPPSHFLPFRVSGGPFAQSAHTLPSDSLIKRGSRLPV